MAAAGRWRVISSTIAVKLPTSCSTGNDALPMTVWTLPLRSDRYSMRPALISLTALATSMVTVPAWGLGIRPRGPSTFPWRPSWPIMSGVAMIESTCSIRSSMSSSSSGPPATSAPASFASVTLPALAMTATRTSLPMPCGSEIAPRTIWSALRGSMPRLNTSSTVGS